MSSRRRSVGYGFRRIRPLAIIGAISLALASTALLSGFQAEPADWLSDSSSPTVSERVTPEFVGIRTFSPPRKITVVPNIAFAPGITEPDGTPLALDVCLPPGTDGVQNTPGTDGVHDTDNDAALPALRPAVVSIHGGSWSRGDKANSDWRQVCVWLASEGFVAVSVNYRLAPADPFPAAIDDVSRAVSWLREPANAERFNIDPERIGAFGGSAGGNLAALLGARGTGSLTEGSRVAAVVVLSAPLDLRESVIAAGETQAMLPETGSPFAQTPGVTPAGDLRRITLRYLGCQTLGDCPAAAEASAPGALDSSDPPFFIANSRAEFTPLVQAQLVSAALRREGVAHEFVEVPGALHSIGILDADVRMRVAAFLHDTLGD
ncbi:alpha/beta hydrolase fold domain-containing protein [Glaciibacter psychrotolerans]|uniref:Acetyl esterase/lipase n=1 Tax=Glaciibacter psychrotolerans TaxID=670054 RepID=A0A7Z0EIC0_9MICO|nr:acetyl esterase/lipase [Leifsonia psychrotolerans]